MSSVLSGSSETQLDSLNPMERRHSWMLPTPETTPPFMARRVSKMSEHTRLGFLFDSFQNNRSKKGSCPCWSSPSLTIFKKIGGFQGVRSVGTQVRECSFLRCSWCFPQKQPQTNQGHAPCCLSSEGPANMDPAVPRLSQETHWSVFEWALLIGGFPFGPLSTNLKSAPEKHSVRTPAR